MSVSKVAIHDRFRTNLEVHEGCVFKVVVFEMHFIEKTCVYSVLELKNESGLQGDPF